ncbi:MAG: hypothetical protein EBQ85_07690 [Proteobacteria bacterium]|nr:hypothetical protein [Pseudomonadota bacterium]
MTIQASTIQKWLLKQGITEPAQVIHLLGDGSSRQFFRVRIAAKGAHYILLSDPSWTLTQDYPAHQQALKSARLPVPAFIAIDPSAGFLLMEDLGDELLQSFIEKNPDQKEQWLKQAIELLADLHGKLYPVSSTLPVSQRRFDQQKYFQELLFTLEHLREKYLGLPAVPQQSLEEVRKFCATLDPFKPWVFCHRDYHCRNLLVHGSSLWMIDFQDARLGPVTYDLASLVYDAYVPLTDEVRGRLISHYKNRLSTHPLFKEISWNSFEQELGLVGYQRTLKAAGSFASFFNRFNKSTHLRYLVPALQMAKTLEKQWGIAPGVAAAFEIDKMIGLLHESKSNH